MAKAKNSPSDLGSKDELAESLAEVINKNNDGGKVAFFLDAQDDPSQILDWVSTGNDLLDLAISNRPNGGVPVGRITELTGLEASGKSLVCAHLLANTQKMGGVAVFIDTEYAVSPEFLTAIGMDIKNMLYITSSTVEDIFEKIEQVVNQVRKGNKNRLVTIVVDSVAAASTTKEMAADHGQDGFATGKAIIISKAMRKITELIAKQRIALVFTNQLRERVGFVGLGDKYTTSGGKALGFHASLRVRLKSLGKITTPDKRAVGIKTKATIVKNRMGPPMKSVEFDIYFDRGIDNYGNWMENLIEWDIITNAKKEKAAPDAKKKTKKELEEEKEMDKKAKSLQFIAEDGQAVVFEKKAFPKLLADNPNHREFLYKKMCDTFVMKYRTDSSDTDEMELDTSSEGVDE